MSVRATMATARYLDRYREDLAAILAQSEPGEVDSRLAALGESIAADDELATLLYRATLHVHLAGQLFVQDVERDRLTTLASDPSTPFLDLPFEEAIANFRDRAIMSPEAFAELSDAERFRSFTMSRAASQRIIERSRALLYESMREGTVGLRQFAAQVAADEVALGFTPGSPSYLENVYRTATGTSYNAGRLRQQTDPAVLAAGGVWQYVTAGDDRVRSEHAALDGKQWAVGDPEALSVYPPNGYQCFVPGTVVEGAVLLGTRARYAGEVVELVTESGRSLTVTPNHPLLTSEGFAPAGSIREGQQLLGHVGGVDGNPVGEVHPYDAPAAIEDVFDALSVGDRPTVRLRPVADDFHGDAKAIQGEVDVVGVDGQLLDHVQSDALKQRRKAVLAASASGHAEVVGDRSLALGGERLRPSPGGIPGTRALTLDGTTVRLEGRPLEPLRIGPGSTLDAPLSKPALDDVAADAEFARDLVLRFPGRVAPDNVIHVNRHSYVGHVYDLQTSQGWLVAGGIYTSNCRCVMVLVDEEDADGAALSRSVNLGEVAQEGFRGPPDEAIAGEASASRI